MSIEISMSLKNKMFIEETLKCAGPKEVGILGVIKTTENGVSFVDHLYIPTQTVSGSEVDWGDDGLADFLDYLVEVGFNESSYGIYSAHSHNNMAVFWSSTDESFIREVGKMGAPYIISSVFNNKGEAKHRLDTFAQVEHIPCLNRENVQITWEDDGDVELNIYKTQKILEAEASLDKIFETLEAKKSEIEKHYEEPICEMRDRVAELELSLRGTVRAEAGGLYKKNVNEYTYSYKSHMPGGNIIRPGDNSFPQNYSGLGYNYAGVVPDEYAGIRGNPQAVDYFTEAIHGQLFDYSWDNMEGYYSFTDEKGDTYYITLDEAKENKVEVWNCEADSIEMVTVEDYLDNQLDSDYANNVGNFFLLEGSGISVTA